jgi:hypothetical protein
MSISRKIIQTACLLAALTSLWLSACTSEPQIRATEMPAESVVVTPDLGLATPTIGYAVVKRFEGMQALRLHSQPDSQSPEAGRVAPGEKGKVLGLNATGTWILVRFPEQSGWAPVPTLDLVIAQ